MSTVLDPPLLLEAAALDALAALGDIPSVPRAFAADANRIVLPAFGAYAGGLDVGDPAISMLFDGRFHGFMLGEERVYAIPRHTGRRKSNEESQPMAMAIRTVASP